MSAAVHADQRYQRGRRCPVCQGADNDPRGQERRCHGYLSSDGDYAHCTREDHAGSLRPTEASTYGHRLRGPCACGVQHGEPVEQPRASSRIEVEYDYRDEQGVLLYQVVRKVPKGFAQRRPGPNGGPWIWGLDGVRRVLYRLDEVIESDRTVFIVEGEKDVDNLHKLGFVATTSSQGAKSWSKTAEHARQVLKGRDVIVIPDGDEDGQRYASDVIASLTGVAGSVRKLELPAKDVSEWIAAGGTADELGMLAAGDRAPHVALLASEVAALDIPPIRSFATGIAGLDRLTGGGVSTRQLLTLIGPPAAGKTACAISISIHVAQAMWVLYASTELEKHELMARIAANLADCPWSSIVRGAVPRDRWQPGLEGVRIRVLGSDDLPRDGAAALALIEREAQAMATANGGAPLVVIDYLQDLARGAERDLRSKIGDLATDVRAIAQRLDCPMIAVSSVARTFYSPKRAAELRELDDPTVYLAAAKESGDVDYASAVVAFLDVDENRDNPERAVRIAVAKSRHGETGFAGARFAGASGRYTDDPAAVDAMSAAGRGEREAEDKVDDADEHVLRGVQRMHNLGEGDRCTKAELKNGGRCGIGSTRVVPALNRLVDRGKLRIELRQRPEGARLTMKTREIYVPVEAS